MIPYKVLVPTEALEKVRSMLTREIHPSSMWGSSAKPTVLTTNCLDHLIVATQTLIDVLKASKEETLHVETQRPGMDFGVQAKGETQ